MISANYTNNNPQTNNIPYGAVKDVVPTGVNEKLPENIQNLDAEKITNSNGALSAGQNINKNTALVALPIYASFVGLRSLNDWAKSPFLKFAGDYEKTTLGRLARVGDVITNAVKKIIPDKVENGVIGKLKGAKNWILDHSALARSATTPLRLENSFAKMEANGIFSRVMSDNATMLTNGFKGGVKELGEVFGTETEFWKLLQKKGIDKLKDTPAAARELVSSTLTELANQPLKSADVQKYTKEIIENLAKSDKKIVIDRWRLPLGKGIKIPIGKIPGLGKLMTLEVPMSEISNKLRTASKITPDVGKGAAAAVGTTMLGKALPSVFSKVYESLTSNFVGGKVAPLMQAFFLASAAMKAKDAPEGQKLATFMDEEACAVAAMFTLPAATSIMTKAGGALKYIGMGKDVETQAKQVAEYRKKVGELNSLVSKNAISRGEYLEKAKEIKNILNCKENGKSTLRFWQKPLKFLGKIFGGNYKQETIMPYLEDAPENLGKLKTFGIGVSNKVQSLLYKFKVSGFNPAAILRFALVMFVLSPILSKPIKMVVNKIFGKPYDPEGDKKAEEKKAKKEQKKNKTDVNNPFTQMTEQELYTLLSKNQNRMMQAQQDEKLMQELTSDPKKLYDFLQQGAQEYDQALLNAKPSELLQAHKQKAANPSYNQNGESVAQPNFVNQPNNFIQQTTPSPQQGMGAMANGQPFNSAINQGANFTSPTPSVQNMQPVANNGQVQPMEPNRTYMPSSAPAPNVLNSSNVDKQKFDALMQDMIATEEEYRKYL